ncbi:hypothetical protein MPSEU_000292100 [Mayamaea pseudoterrestris]|nr:hypothetical protein MPSEU_000292100 [Mayamaea pseudoterrestris]
MAMSSANEPSAEPEVETTETVTDKAAAPSKPVDSQVPLTYFGSIESSAYKYGWECLQAGAFDDGLEAAEMGLQETKARVLDLFQTNAETMDMDKVELHESMAPFFYLYGTTLLYSVEEQSSEQLAALTMNDAPPEAASANAHDSDESEASAAAEQVKEDYADDLEIAWENLEIARTTLEIMLQQVESSETMTVKKEKIQLDLAQVCLRAADLQRMNGQYENAVRDFEHSLQLRLETPLLGPYDRKIADVYMNLGATYFVLVSSTTTADSENPVPAMDPKELEKKLAIWRNRGFYNTFMAGKTLCGQLAMMCGVDPTQFFQKAEQNVASFKSTGLEKHEEEMEHPTTLSLKLKSLREHAGKMEPLHGQKDLFDEISEMLVEIQETIDEGEAGEEGVHKVQQMKADIAAAMAAEQDLEDHANEGSATTIGFGSAAAAATTATAQPMAAMMVKKKKKREDLENVLETEPVAKQMKTATE